MQWDERKRGRKVLRQVQQVREVAEAIIHRYHVHGLLDVQYHERVVSQRPVRRYRERAAGTRVECEVSLSVQLDAAAVAQVESCLGWHVYVTNQQASQLSLEQAVLAYRGEYVIERGFGRLKGRPLSVRPMQLTSDTRVDPLALAWPARALFAGIPGAVSVGSTPRSTTRRPTSDTNPRPVIE